MIIRILGHIDQKILNKKNKKYLLSPIDNMGAIVYSLIKIKGIKRFKKNDKKTD